MKIHVEVFIAAQILGKNQSVFSPQDLMGFIRREFKDERHGINTHVTAASVANAPLNHANGYNYLWRLYQGEYRPFRQGQDLPKSERQNDRSQPLPVDVPEKYYYLLRKE